MGLDSAATPFGLKAMESLQEINKYDALLIKHVQEMEEFEIYSKQNRAALLHGNSKALVEEEKFRKNGKRYLCQFLKMRI